MCIHLCVLSTSLHSILVCGHTHRARASERDLSICIVALRDIFVNIYKEKVEKKMIERLKRKICTFYRIFVSTHKRTRTLTMSHYICKHAIAKVHDILTDEKCSDIFGRLLQKSMRLNVFHSKVPGRKLL